MKLVNIAGRNPQIRGLQKHVFQRHRAVRHSVSIPHLICNNDQHRRAIGKIKLLLLCPPDGVCEASIHALQNLHLRKDVRSDVHQIHDQRAVRNHQEVTALIVPTAWRIGSRPQDSLQLVRLHRTGVICPHAPAARHELCKFHTMLLAFCFLCISIPHPAVEKQLPFCEDFRPQKRQARRRTCLFFYRLSPLSIRTISLLIARDLFIQPFHRLLHLLNLYLELVALLSPFVGSVLRIQRTPSQVLAPPQNS